MSAQEYFKIVHAAVTYARSLSQWRGRLNLLVVIRLLNASLPILISDLIDSGLFVNIRQVSTMSMPYRKTKEGRLPSGQFW